MWRSANTRACSICVHAPVIHSKMAAAGPTAGLTASALVRGATDALTHLITPVRQRSTTEDGSAMFTFGTMAMTLMSLRNATQSDINSALLEFCILSAPRARGGTANFDAYIAATGGASRSKAALRDGGLTFWDTQQLGGGEQAVTNLTARLGRVNLIHIYASRMESDRPFSHPIDLVAVGSSIYASLIANAMQRYIGPIDAKSEDRVIMSLAGIIEDRLDKHGNEATSQANALKVENLFFICTASLDDEGNV